MNKAEFKAIKMIAEKLQWKQVNFKTINQMVKNQQSLELDTVGECDDDEVVLLSLALWSVDKIVSTMYVNDYTSLANWCYFLETMHIDGMTAHALLSTYDQVKTAIAEDQDAEYEAYLEDYYSDYDAEIMRDVIWMNHNC